ncbi:protein of unknown function [Haloarcula vallismortis]|uniref:DUF4382 domain-containing protein n=2 Tax=Haloarcula vallismortis TaxID=28442 RepID=M0IXK5_HALVA|nr:DUF4382 domain-containing protein [Haloarcula vallismortis]EMA00803.1 hypothetical protein C437_18432 [Haloarcula vallismortis ATCC 29715]SDW06195.1 protein of unknown function [Haloarcula vallismortis]
MRESQRTQATSRRDYLKAAGSLAAASTVGLAGCSGSGAETGTLATQVTDQPGDIGDFESCIVTMAGLWVKPASEEDTATEESTTASTSDAREYHEFDDPQEADLVQLQDGNTSLVDETELEVDTYEYLQLDVTGVDATLAEGGDATVDTPGEAPLQFTEEYEIRADTRTVFTADFTPVKRGQTGEYILQPVASGTEVKYEE